MRRQDIAEAPQPLVEPTPLDERLAHRALGLLNPRAEAPAMSKAARDRLYARMFPQHLCGGGDDACSD